MCKICIARSLVVDIFPLCNANFVPFLSRMLVACRMGNGRILCLSRRGTIDFEYTHKACLSCLPAVFTILLLKDSNIVRLLELNINLGCTMFIPPVVTFHRKVYTAKLLFHQLPTRHSDTLISSVTY